MTQKPILRAFVHASLLGVAFGWLCVQGCKLVLREAAEIRIATVRA
jgi:hypothetical protein